MITENFDGIAGWQGVGKMGDNGRDFTLRVPEPVTTWRQLIKDTKARYLYCRSSMIRQPGGELDLNTALDYTRLSLAQSLGLKY